MEGLTWDVVKLEHVGRDADDGTTLKDEIDHLITEAAKAVADVKVGDTATITAKITVKRTGAGGSVLVQGTVAAKMPSRLRLGVGALLADGQLVTQAGRQVDVEDILRAAREVREEVEMAPRERHRPKWRRDQVSAAGAAETDGGAP
jgi:hypothetical protein